MLARPAIGDVEGEERAGRRRTDAARQVEGDQHAAEIVAQEIDFPDGPVGKVMLAQAASTAMARIAESSRSMRIGSL